MKMKNLAALVAATALSLGGISAAHADDGGGYSHDPSNPTLVTEVPDGFAALGDPTVTEDDCITTTTQVFSRYTPGSTETTHQEWGSEERTRTSTEVPDYITEYHFRKFTHTKTRAPAGPDLWWNWSPNDSQGPQDYVPDFPTDERGTWQGPHENGGPMQDTYGTFQTGGGNSPFFHREHGTPQGDWSDYGPWTPWVPETHESWQTSTDPLGVPEYHGSGTYPDGTEWYREWQAQFDGTTRQVQTGSHTEYGEWTEWTVLETGLLEEPVLPENTDTHEYRATGPVTVGNGDGTEGFTEYVYTVTEQGTSCKPPHHNPPKHHTPPEHHTPPASTPDVPTVVDAGL